MYIYICYFFLILLLGVIFFHTKFLKGKNVVKLYSIIVCLGLIFISGFRNESVGVDTSMYKYIWESFRPGKITNVDVDFEYGFAYLMIFLRQFIDYPGFLIIVACLSIIPVSFVVEKYSKNVCYSFLLFYSSILFHTLEFAAERQAIAFGGVILSFHFIMKRNLRAFLLVLLACYFFHHSSVIFLPCYWLYSLKINKKMICIWSGILLLMFVFGNFVLNYFNSFWRQEYGVSDDAAGGTRYFLLQCVIVGIGFYKYKLLNSNIFIKVPFLIYSISVLLWPILRINPALFRLTYYFDFFVALFIPNFLSIITSHKVIGKITFAISVFMMFYVIFVLRMVEAYYPYKFIWEY